MGVDIFSVLGGSSGATPIPTRDPGAVSGTTFCQNNMLLTGAAREVNILNEFLTGNIPNFLRNFIPVSVSNGVDSITYMVMPDVLSIGSDADYVRMPMNPHTAQIIANQYDCTLPTKKMVDSIWRAAANKLPPQPWGPPYDATMMATERFLIHNGRIQNQLIGKDPHALSSGHKKDVVITNRLSPHNPNKRVAIYGWILPNGQAIQGLNPTSHEDSYLDYSHGIRMISKDILVNGNAMRIDDVFSSAQLVSLISDEGILTFTRY